MEKVGFAGRVICLVTCLVIYLACFGGGCSGADDGAPAFSPAGAWSFSAPTTDPTIDPGVLPQVDFLTTYSDPTAQYQFSIPVVQLPASRVSALKLSGSVTYQGYVVSLSAGPFQNVNIVLNDQHKGTARLSGTWSETIPQTSCVVTWSQSLQLVFDDDKKGTLTLIQDAAFDPASCGHVQQQILNAKQKDQFNDPFWSILVNNYILNIAEALPPRNIETSYFWYAVREN